MAKKRKQLCSIWKDVPGKVVQKQIGLILKRFEISEVKKVGEGCPGFSDQIIDKLKNYNLL